MQTSYVRKYPKNKDDFDNFRNWQLNFKSWKTAKSRKRSRKVMEFEKLLKSANPDRTSCSVCDKSTTELGQITTFNKTIIL